MIYATLSERMRAYEDAESQRRFIPYIPICARMDGRAFHRFCRDMRKPFDYDFMACMCTTTAWLVEATNADVGYTQSDEITLVWKEGQIDREPFFGGKVQKIVSHLAAWTTLKFNQCVLADCILQEFATLNPTFDACAWNVPNLDEATNVLIHREQDCRRNSLHMLARAHFSHNECMDKDTSDFQKMLAEKNVSWSKLPHTTKYGSHYRRATVTKRFTAEELKNLPPKHEAHNNPECVVLRHVVESFAIPDGCDFDTRKDIYFNAGISRYCH